MEKSTPCRCAGSNDLRRPKINGLGGVADAWFQESSLELEIAREWAEKIVVVGGVAIATLARLADGRTSLPRGPRPDRLRVIDLSSNRDRIDKWLQAGGTFLRSSFQIQVNISDMRKERRSLGLQFLKYQWSLPATDITQ